MIISKNSIEIKAFYKLPFSKRYEAKKFLLCGLYGSFDLDVIKIIHQHERNILADRN